MKYIGLRLLWVATWVVVLLPALVIIAIYVNWFVMRLQLQRSPVPMMDDPATIDGPAQAMYSVLMPRLAMWSNVFVAAFSLTFIASIWPKQSNRRVNFRILSASIILVVAAFSLMKWEPFGAIEGYCD